jgi:hypothetical protein
MGLFNDIKNGISNLFNINNYSALSYASLLNDIQKFKKSGTNSGSEFNYFDTKGHKFFKILFYFGQDANTDNNGGFSSGGLLTPTWTEYDGSKTSNNVNKKFIDIKLFNTGDNATAEDYSYYENELMNLHNYNSAWAYLMLNGEIQRARHLEQFVNLLSNISSESPWYFMALEGLDAAMERKMASDGKVELGETKKITIKCIEDAFDNRISTLLDLYRDFTWSWNMKREILPSNLRKFDMAVYIFESPVLDWHENEDTIDSSSGYQPSYKMLEFHNCEIDYNSSKTAWGEFSNEGGKLPQYNIEIKYDDCYEISYNEFIMEKIGDVIITDFYTKYLPGDSIDTAAQLAGLGKRANPYDKGLLGNAIDQLVSTGVNYLEDKLERALLGNLHTYSLTNIGSQIKDVLDGNVIKTVQAAKDYIDDGKKRKENAHKTSPTNNISTNNKHDRPVEFDNDITGPTSKLFEDEVSEKEQPNGNILDSELPKKEQPSGDLFDNEIPRKEQPSGDLFDNEVPKKEQPSGDLFDNEVPKKEQPNGDLFDNEVPKKEQPNGNILDSELPKKEQPSGDLFDNEVPRKEQPIGNIMNSKIPKKEQPSGNIIGLSGQQLAALKFKAKPKGKIFDSNI